MKNKRIFLPAIFILLTLAVLFPNSIHPIKAQFVGVVCLSPSSVAQCPAPPVTVSAPVGSQMSVYVIVQGSDGLDGFDITLFANHTIIRPADASLTGSILSAEYGSQGMIIDKCVGGVLKTGPVCQPTDNVDTIHLAATESLGSPNTIAPTTGLLFTAIYNVTRTTTTPISFQTGCSPSSVSATTACVEIDNGTPTPIPETVQTAGYTPAPTPTFTIGTDITGTQISITKGETGNLTITLTSLNGFAGTISLSPSLTPSTKHQPSIALSSSIVSLTQGGSGTVVLSASATNNTTRLGYVVTVTGTSGSQTASVQIQLYVFT